MKQLTFNQIVAAEIRAEMGRQDISQAGLAAELGWAQSQLSRRLRGLVAFSTDEIERIALWLDVPIRQLVSPQPASGPDQPATQGFSLHQDDGNRGITGRLRDVATAGRR